MDLLQSLIVPPAQFTGLPDAVNGGLPQSFSKHRQLDPGTTSTSSATTIDPTAFAATQEPGTARKRKRKRNKQSQKQRRREQQIQQQQQQQSNTKHTKTPAVSAPKTPTGVQKAKKRSKYQLYHPDKPRSTATGRRKVSHEDLCYDDSAQQPLSPPSEPQTLPISQWNSDSSQTCFFWYHGSCRRGHDKGGCNLNHALSDPPSMVEAPPGFVHPNVCKLEWCAGDGTKKREKRRGDGEGRKRYFDVPATEDDGSDDGSSSETEGEGMDFFLGGFDEIGA